MKFTQKVSKNNAIPRLHKMINAAREAQTRRGIVSFGSLPNDDETGFLKEQPALYQKKSPKRSLDSITIYIYASHVSFWSRLRQFRRFFHQDFHIEHIKNPLFLELKQALYYGQCMGDGSVILKVKVSPQQVQSRNQHLCLSSKVIAHEVIEGCYALHRGESIFHSKVDSSLN